MKVKSFSSILILVGICMISATSVSAQADKKSVAQITFVPPLSTNGLDAAQYTNAFSFNVLVGVSKNETALTFGSLANIISNNSSGVQFAGLCNYVGNDGTGILFSGLANITGNSYSGLQFAGLLNTAKEMKGFQFSGLANVADNVDGVQFAGLINIAKNVSGVQFAGLVNVAESSDCPIGLLNLIRNGEYSLAVSYNDIGSTVATFRSGGKATYGILGLGYNHKTKGSAFVTTGGFGAHINLASWFRINNELSGETIGNFSKETTFRVGYALMPAFRIGHIELFGGPSINYLHSDNVNNASIFPKQSLWKDFGSSKLQQVSIGYQAGVQYIF